MTLLVDYCDYKAAKYAVEKWHYSRTMPSTYTRLVKFGVWENNIFTGALIFSHGSNRNIGSPYGLTIFQCIELVRVALKTHLCYTSQIAAKALKCIVKQSPGVRLLVSYADPTQGHFGILYQALNFYYVGETPRQSVFVKNGKEWHKKAAWATFGTNKLESLDMDIKYTEGKHKYLYPLDRAMRRQIAPLAQPYPKRADS